MASSVWPIVQAQCLVWSVDDLAYVPMEQPILEGETVNVNVSGPLDVTATPIGSGTATATNVNDSASNVTLLAANPNRLGNTTAPMRVEVAA